MKRYVKGFLHDFLTFIFMHIINVGSTPNFADNMKQIEQIN